MISDKEPFVSVIIPNYCHAKYLDERIQSVLGQTYQNFEVIILDDCSTDNSMEVINRYKDHPKVAKIVVNEKNNGSPFKQWQKGIAMARGEIIWIAESDDSCEPAFLETLVKKFQDEGAVFTFCRSKKIDELGKEKDNSFQNVFNGDFVLDGRSFINKYLIQAAYVENISSAIFSKQAALQVGDYYTTFRGAGDWVFTIELSLMGKVVFIDQTLNLYRVHSNSTTTLEYESGHNEFEICAIYKNSLQRGIISKRQYRKIRRDKLRDIHFRNYQKEVKLSLFSLWEINPIEKGWILLLDIYNSLLLLRKRVF